MTDAGSENESAMPVETRAIVADLRRVRDRPPPADPSSGGCVVAIVAIVTAVLIPFIGLALSLSGGAMLGIGLGLGAIAVAGILLGAFGGGFVSGAVAGDVEEAIVELVTDYPDGDERRLRQAAIRILDGAYVSTGPTTVGTFEARDVAERLGDALPYVERIERILLERQEIYPVFTTLREEGPPREWGD